MAIPRAHTLAAASLVAAAALVGAARAPQAAPGSVSAGVLLVAVGDIACPPGHRPTARSCHHAATARVAERLRPVAVALLGDTQYDNAGLADYRRSFALTWGRLKPRLRPAPGNHEYNTPGAAGYFAYFGSAAGPRGRGYYSYDLGAWHVVVLNSQCAAVSCARGSPQERWLRADLAAHPRRCTLAYWHHPRFSSGHNGEAAETGPFWQALHQAGADVVLNGHEHSYERFAPQDPGRRPDPTRGIRQFVVGTGGVGFHAFTQLRPHSQRRQNHTFGVLALRLQSGGYTWRFVPEPGGRFADSGSGRCH